MYVHIMQQLLPIYANQFHDCSQFLYILSILCLLFIHVDSFFIPFCIFYTILFESCAKPEAKFSMLTHVQ